jgi:SAM-dependent methyltransferase
MKYRQWQETTSGRFTNVIKGLSNDLFDSPSLQRLRKIVDLNKAKKMLSVGSGNGRFELALMNHFPMLADFIEPSAIMHAQLMKNIEKHRGPGKAGQVFHGPFEKFTGTTKYDLVYAVHSFYFLKDPVEGVRKALRLLNPGGDLAIILHLKEGFGFRLIKEFDHNRLQGGLSAEWLSKNAGIPCETSIIEMSLPADEFVIGKELTLKGEMYAAFYANRDWQTFLPAEKLRARQIFADFTEGPLIKERQGVLHFKSGPY